MELALEAADQWRIPNDRSVVPVAQSQIDQIEATLRLTIAAAKRVGPPSAFYNCHGLTFGTRRTWIPAPDLDVDVTTFLQELLRRDGYRRSPTPLEGDVAVYRAEDGSIDHTGVVCWIAVEMPVVYVWSMWGALGEFVHKENVTPYSDCTIEYWRLCR